MADIAHVSAPEEAGFRPRHEVVVFVGPTGAPGITASAIGFADACARLKLRTIVVDADPYGAKLTDWLGADAVHSIHVLAQASQFNPATPQQIEIALHHLQKPAGLSLVAGFESPRVADSFDRLTVPNLVTALRNQCDVLVIDAGRIHRPWTLSLMTQADHIVCVFVPNEEGAFALNRAWGYYVLADKMPIRHAVALANRYHGDDEFRNLATVLKNRFGLPLASRVPENTKAFQASWAERHPVRPEDVDYAYDRLVSSLFPQIPLMHTNKSRGGGIGRLLGR